ncbi:hypothetical protein M422DRAFT_55371 [Sphaerobolus stellatus SS14]|uniref:Unplaced genomic scaffold SPHSTscaffold_282, whole genome shotgun sequence n=1 Tax=Sphaerobolus stellatus (strain SS14) TaxID=990650 RepID=A0A0C9TY75_SPHS4|nr:hypothetical protein M422DRAFT_55371 [Sphaerobolus stellatus SS14]
MSRIPVSTYTRITRSSINQIEAEDSLHDHLAHKDSIATSQNTSLGSDRRTQPLRKASAADKKTPALPAPTAKKAAPPSYATGKKTPLDQPSVSKKKKVSPPSTVTAKENLLPPAPAVPGKKSALAPPNAAKTPISKAAHSYTIVYHPELKDLAFHLGRQELLHSNPAREKGAARRVVLNMLSGNVEDQQKALQCLKRFRDGDYGDDNIDEGGPSSSKRARFNIAITTTAIPLLYLIRDHRRSLTTHDLYMHYAPS